MAHEQRAAIADRGADEAVAAHASEVVDAVAQHARGAAARVAAHRAGKAAAHADAMHAAGGGQGPRGR